MERVTGIGGIFFKAQDPERLKAFNNRIGDQVGHELFNAYLASLKSKADVKINQANLEKK